MKDSARYVKLVEWSDEDEWYRQRCGKGEQVLRGERAQADIRRVPRPDEKAVFDELCGIVEKAIALYHKDHKPLPPPTAGRDYANTLQGVA